MVLHAAINAGLPKALPDNLQLQLVHPTRKGEDQAINLIRTGTLFKGPLTANPGTGRWNVVIEDPLAGWRMDGVWNIKSKKALRFLHDPNNFVTLKERSNMLA